MASSPAVSSGVNLTDIWLIPGFYPKHIGVSGKIASVHDRQTYRYLIVFTANLPGAVTFSAMDGSSRASNRIITVTVRGRVGGSPGSMRIGPWLTR